MPLAGPVVSLSDARTEADALFAAHSGLLGRGESKFVESIGDRRRPHRRR